MTINISTCTETELKALAFDLIVQKENILGQLSQVTQEIQKRKMQPVEENKEEKQTA